MLGIQLISSIPCYIQAEVPLELSNLLKAMSDGKLSSSTKYIKATTNGIDKRYLSGEEGIFFILVLFFRDKECNVLILDGSKYAVVGTVLLLLKIVSEYCR